MPRHLGMLAAQGARWADEATGALTVPIHREAACHCVDIGLAVYLPDLVETGYIRSRTDDHTRRLLERARASTQERPCPTSITTGIASSTATTGSNCLFSM